MGSIANLVEKNVTKVATSTGSKILEKLNGKTNNIYTTTFPHNLENQAQSTYMVIYILDNVSNTTQFSTTVFDSDVSEDTFEIPAVTFLKQYAQQELDNLKQYAKDQLKNAATSAKEYLKSVGEDALKSTGIGTTYQQIVNSEAVNWAKTWLVPRRVHSESSALKSRLDVVNNPSSGYNLKEAIALQMPTSSLTYTYENGWESADTSTLNTIKSLIGGLQDTIKGWFGDKNAKANADKLLSGVGKKVEMAIGNVLSGGGFGAEKQESQRIVANPVLAFNYTVPQPRTFTYKFTLYPRNKEELYTLFNLIQKLKFYSLPQISSKNKDKNRDLWYNYPAKFAIKFYTNGYENKWFPSTMALGLTSIEETLTGEGGDMAFFENYFDKESGNPPRLVELTLRFKELGILSRDYANAGY